MNSRLAAVLVLLAANMAIAAERAPPRRVVSLNLCADQVLVGFGDRRSIASLSPSAADPDFSFVAEQARGLPLNRGEGETIALDPPDLVLAGPWDSRARHGMLGRSGAEVVLVSPWRTIEEGTAEMVAIAARLGHPERGRAFADDMAAALAQARALALAPRRFLVLERRGYVPPPVNIVTFTLEAAGMVDASRAWNLPLGGFASIERILVERPDYLVLTGEDLAVSDQGSLLLDHPALARLYPAERRIVVPRRLILCDGPATPRAMRALAAAAARLVR